jgi:hypothetical protein
LTVFRLLTAASLIALVIGCGQSPTRTSATSTADLTADDLAHANDIRWWFVTAKDVPKGKRLCMSFVDEDGIIESRACPDVKKGDRIKVVLSGFSDWDLRYSLVTRNNAYRSTVSNHFRGYDGPSIECHSGAEVNVGEFLVKKSNGEGVTTDTAIQPMEIGLTFTFEDEAQPWRRKGYEWPGKDWKTAASREAIPGN